MTTTGRKVFNEHSLKRTMQINVFKEIVSSIAGSNGAKIVDLLYDKKNVNEFLIAKKLKLTINQTRNVLYKLGDEGLISFVRKKDKKKGGWYTYFWTLNFGKSLQKFSDKLKDEVAKLKAEINNKKNNQFFACPNCHLEYTSEQALLSQYTCSECGEVLELKDNSAQVIELEKQLSKVSKVLTEIDSELNIFTEIAEKSKQRRIKAEAKKKQKERQAKRAAKVKLKKKEQSKKKKKK